MNKEARTMKDVKDVDVFKTIQGQVDFIINGLNYKVNCEKFLDADGNVDYNKIVDYFYEDFFEPEYEQNPDNRVITECEFKATEFSFEVWIMSECDGCYKYIKIFESSNKNLKTWFTFTSNDFVGLTETEAKDMIDCSYYGYLFDGIDEEEDYSFYDDLDFDDIPEGIE